MRQRTEPSPSSGIVQLGIPVITQTNDEQDVDVTIGALGDALAQGGFTGAVVGNGDGLHGRRRRRHVPPVRGQRADGLGRHGARRTRRRRRCIEPNDAAPFGVQADLDATVDAFQAGVVGRSRSCWSKRPTSRASATTRRSRRRRNASAARDALERSDELVGRLLDEVDPTRDAVIVLGTGPSINGDALTVAAHAGAVGRARAAAVGEHAPQRLRAPRRRRADHPRHHRAAARQGHVGKPVRGEDRHARRRRPARAYLISESKAGIFRDKVRGPVVLTYTDHPGRARHRRRAWCSGSAAARGHAAWCVTRRSRLSASCPRSTSRVGSRSRIGARSCSGSRSGSAVSCWARSTR